MWTIGIELKKEQFIIFELHIYKEDVYGLYAGETSYFANKNDYFKKFLLEFCICESFFVILYAQIMRRAKHVL